MSRIAILVAFVTGIAPSALAGPLHDAARAGDLEAVETLLAEGAVIDERGPSGETPLILAILEGREAVAEVLVGQGADIRGRNEGGFTPLHAAAYVGDVDAAERLLGQGVAVNDQMNKAGVTPLSVAAEEGHTSVARLLMERGADLETNEQNGFTRALWRGHSEVVALLRQAGAKCQPVEVLEEPAYSECVAGQLE